MKTSNLLYIAFLPIVLASFSLPMFRRPQALPVERLTKNLEARIAKAPQDAELYYTLGRVHYLAMMNQTHLVPAYDRSKQGVVVAPPRLAAGFLQQVRYGEASRRAKKALGFGPDTKMDRAKWNKLSEAIKPIFQKLEADDWRPRPLNDKELLQHAKQAMARFDKAIELAPKAALYHLGRASLAEQCLELVAKNKLPRHPRPEFLASWKPEKVRAEYFEAFELSFPAESKRDHQPLGGLDALVSYEAGNAYVRLTKGDSEIRASEHEKIAEVKKGLDKLEKLPRGPITPIVFGRSPSHRLDELLDPAATVTFDLDGDGVREAWPWVKPSTHFLVWDPLDQREITSGRQLFGSVTFFLFHRDGYAALELLDDDLDGELTGLELEGLAVWTDRDGDGCSTGGEVAPLWQSGIVAIRTAATRDADGVLSHPAGLVFEDDSVLPTFDWVTRPRHER